MESVRKPVDVASVFASLPGCHLILLPDAPQFTVVEATDAYLAATYCKREQIIGQGVFHALTDNPNNPLATGVKNLSASLHQVANHKKKHHMADQRYDVYNPSSGRFELRVWRPINKPVIGDDGEVQYIIHTVEDITETIQWQEATLLSDQRLEESENRFRNIIEQASNPILIFHGENMILEDANEALFRTWNMDRSVIGKPLLEILPQTKEEGFFDMMQKVYFTGEPEQGYGVPATFYDGDSSRTVYFNVTYQAIKSGSGEVTGVLVMAYDVTKQVLYRQQVEESEQRFRALVTTTANVVYRMNSDWSEMRELQGLGFLNDTGQPIVNWLQKYIHRNDQQRVKEAVQKAINNKSVFELEHQVMRKDGTFGWSFSRAVPILDNNGEVMEWFGTAYDITQRKQTEEELRATTEEIEKQKRLYETITSNTPDLIYVFDLNYRFTYANEALLTMWEKTWEEAIGKGLPENGYEDWHTAMHHREIDQVVATKQPIRGEVSFPHAVLGRRLYDYIFVPVINEKGEVEAVAGTTRDITEIKKAEEVLKQNSEKLEALVAERTRELQRSNKELEEFAYAASHDMKEPIRKIHFFADRLKERLEGKLEDEDRRYFDRLEMGTRRMTSLIDDLLLYSHVSRGKHSEEMVDLNQTLAFVLDDLELHVEEKGAHIEVGSLPTINGHERQLQQLFENLLGNALKYSKPDVPPQISITCEQVKGSDNAFEHMSINRNKKHYLIQVRDNGIGFPQEDAERIFNVFTRLHGNAEYRGTGVGLSIAQKVVQNHGGCIWAESKAGEGATFNILLPII